MSAFKWWLFGVSFVLSAVDVGVAQCPQVEASGEDYPFLGGRYEIVGRLPDSDSTYGGTVELRWREGAFVAARTVNGQATRGTAWLQNCGGVDRRLSLRFRYARTERDPATLNMVCTWSIDGDNATRLTCKTGYGERQINQRLGIEALFQMIE